MDAHTSNMSERWLGLLSRLPIRLRRSRLRFPDLPALFAPSHDLTRPPTDPWLRQR
jgi:hypothetical protein